MVWGTYLVPPCRPTDRKLVNCWNGSNRLCNGREEAVGLPTGNGWKLGVWKTRQREESRRLVGQRTQSRMYVQRGNSTLKLCRNAKTLKGETGAIFCNRGRLQLVDTEKGERPLNCVKLILAKITVNAHVRWKIGARINPPSPLLRLQWSQSEAR